MALIPINSRNETEIKLVPNNVAEIDITANVTNMNGTYDSVNIPQSGISVVSGALTLTQTNTSFDFDDRYNENLSRGVLVETNYTDPVTNITYPYPVIGRLYIKNSKYNFDSQLTLGLTCILGLLHYRTPRDLGICIEFGSGVDVAVVVSNLLQAAGVPIANIDSASFTNLLGTSQLLEPLPVDQGSSIIDMASKLCAQHGTVMFQNNSGNVKLVDFKDLTDKAILFSKDSRDMHLFERNSAVESKVKQLILNYTEVESCDDTGDKDTETISGASRFTVFKTFDTANRVVTTDTDEFYTFQAVETQVQETTVTETFELEPSESATLVRIGQSLPNGECYPVDPGRLLTRVTEIFQDNSAIMEVYNSSRAAASSPGPAPGLVGVQTFSITTETWNYVSDIFIQQIIEEKVPVGYAIPLSGDLSFGRGVGTFTALDPNTLITFRVITNDYRKTDDICTNWSLLSKTQVNQYVEKPEYVTERAKDLGVTLQTIYDEAVGILIETEREFSANVGEPSPPRWITEVSTGRRDFQIIFGTDLGTGTPGSGIGYGFDVIDTVFLGEFSGWNTTDIQNTGKQIMRFRNGRILGIQMADSPFAMDFDCWPDFAPMFMAKVQEPYKRDRAGIFIGDSPTVTLTPTETICGFLGIFLGENTNLNDPFDVSFIQTNTLPTVDVNVFTPPTATSLGEIIEETNVSM